MHMAHGGVQQKQKVDKECYLGANREGCAESARIELSACCHGNGLCKQFGWVAEKFRAKAKRTHDVKEDALTHSFRMAKQASGSLLMADQE